MSSLIVENAEWVLFVWIMANQGGLPVPVVPALFGVGALVASGRLSIVTTMSVAVVATLCADLQEPPYGFVQVQGNAELSEDPAELLRTATAIGARYMGQGRAEEFGKRNAVPGELVVRLRPTKVTAALNMTA